MCRLLAVLGAVIAIATSGCQRQSLPERLTGAGSTFVDPLMSRWTAEYRRAESEDVRYVANGSTGGIIWMTEKKADFGCTDAPMTDEQLVKARKAGGDVVHVPLVLGAVVPVYHVPGLKQPLRLTGAVLADIYLGKVTRWNDAALSDLNPDAGLPDLPIAVVHRADGAGTTYIFTDFLGKTSPAWKQAIGASQVPAWPVGAKETGNEGVAQYVKNTAGSIGYVELAFAHQHDLAAGLVQNREKEYVKATVESTSAAAAGIADLPDDLRFSLTDPPGKGAYPICGATWAVLYLKQPGDRGQKVVAFLRWIIHDGQANARELLFAPLPPALVDRAEAKLRLIDTEK
jgi:phosphate ABC transporter phosphate-binding protein